MLTEQTEDARQSEDERQWNPLAQRGQAVFPPQSTSVSLPSLTQLEHVAGTGVPVGDTEGVGDRGTGQEELHAATSCSWAAGGHGVPSPSGYTKIGNTL